MHQLIPILMIEVSDRRECRLIVYRSCKLRYRRKRGKSRGMVTYVRNNGYIFGDTHNCKLTPSSSPTPLPLNNNRLLSGIQLALCKFCASITINFIYVVVTFLHTARAMPNLLRPFTSVEPATYTYTSPHAYISHYTRSVC